jgi:hypothetical protein
MDTFENDLGPLFPFRGHTRQGVGVFAIVDLKGRDIHLSIVVYDCLSISHKVGLLPRLY